MRQEPPLDHAAMIATLRARYGLAVERLAYIPAGLYGACYAAHAGGDRHFLKVWPKPVPGYVTTDLTFAMLAATRALADGGFAIGLPPRAMSDGALAGFLDERLFALFEFIDGAAPTADEAYARETGEGMAVLHRTGDAVDGKTMPRETLDVWFDAGLRKHLARLAAVTDADPPAVHELRDRVMPIAGEITALLERLAVLQAKVRAGDPPFVLCHRDLGTHNTLREKGGRIRFIDWDDIAFAPAEHDLQAVRGPLFRMCLDAYLAEGGVQPLSIDRLAFVVLRRFLDDLHFNVRAVLTGDASSGDAAHQVAGIDRWFLPQWKEREAIVGEMLDALRASGVAR